MRIIPVVTVVVIRWCLVEEGIHENKDVSEL